MSAAVSGLSPDTLYHFRLEATNAAGTAFGFDQELGTGPSVAGESAGGIRLSDATISAQVDPNTDPTTFQVEYGPSAGSYPDSTSELSAGSADTASTAQAQLTGLQPGTTYHYRVVATNAIDTSDGPDQTFTTVQPPPTFGGCPNDQLRYGYGAYLPDCRAYEQVTPVDKQGGSAADSLDEVQAAGVR